MFVILNSYSKSRLTHGEKGQKQTITPDRSSPLKPTPPGEKEDKRPMKKEKTRKRNKRQPKRSIKRPNLTKREKKF